MLGAYVLCVDIVEKDSTTSLEKFRQRVSSSLSHLDALKGSFDRSPCRVTFYPPFESQENPDYGFHSLRAIVMISLGRQRAEFLHPLYQAVARLIELELSDLEVRVEISGFQFA